MQRRDFLKTAGASLGVTTLGAFAQSPKRPPNVVLIMSDDQGWGDIGSHGNPLIDTPVLDQLAREGIRFDRFYVSPVCAPTRASLLTGRYHLRTGTTWVTHGKEIMAADEVTIAQVFKDAGYATGCYGKWHNGANYPHHPLAKGFDRFLGFCAGHWNNYFDTTLDHDGIMKKSKGYITDVFTDGVLDFIREHREEPFFCYIPYNAPHGPFQVPDRYFDKYKARGLDDKNACIYGMCENIDDNVGRILKRLEEESLAEDTIVVFLTDNGPNGKRFNGDMMGAKASPHEGGVRVPLFMRWPGRFKSGVTVQGLSAHIDLLPTLAGLCGVPVPASLQLDGIDVSADLLKNEALPERTLYTFHTFSGEIKGAPAAVRDNRYRAVYDRRKKVWRLFDMLKDPGEKSDLADALPDTLAKMRQGYEKLLAEIMENPPEVPPTLVGHPKAPEVTLSAPEATLNGVAFKGRKGWANDWITNWASTDASAAWRINVAEAGNFEVELHYACPAKEIGSRMRVEVGNAGVEGVVAKAHDPAELPSPDRAPRNGVYEKVWGRLSLGQFALPKGQATLRVRALSIASVSALDLKAVRLRKLG
jgi:arylsulfatase A-like enzyme